MQDAVVTLTSPGILGVMEATTNENGRYWFPAVPGNHELRIRAEATGLVPLEYVGHTARRGGSISIDFRLRAPGDHEILVLIEDGIPYHRVALDGALSTMPGNTTTLVIRDRGPATVRELKTMLEAKPSAVLAIGDTAARLARRHIRDVPIVFSMVPAPIYSDLTTTNICGVPLNGGFDAQIEHLLHVDPGVRRIATIYDPHRMGHELDQLTRAARAAGIDLVTTHVHGEDHEDVTRALAALEKERPDAFILLMDPRFLSRRGFEDIARYVREHDLVLAVPDASLAVGERSFAFVPGFWNMGAYTGLLVQKIVEGNLQPEQIGMVYPDTGDLAQFQVPVAALTPGEMLPDDRVAVLLAGDE